MAKKKIKILIIEDETALADMLKLNLESAGKYEASIANDGREGLKKAREGHYDLVILDLCLPELPGEEVCRQIRRDREICDMPIIMVTAKTSDTDRIIGKVIGANCYITKPFQINELLEDIDKLIKK